MKLSIIVPAYNEEKNIAKTLKGLTQQSYPNIELIVIDNNSQDKTQEIAKEYCDRVYLETQQGYIPAVNRGAKEATGDLITICDADSIYPKQWAEEVITAFQKDPQIVGIYGTADTHDAHAIQNWINGFLYTLFLRISRFLGLDNTSGFNFIMKRETFIKVGGYDPKFKKMSPDIELGKRIGAVGKLIFCPHIKVRSSFRRYQESGTTQTQWMFMKAWWAMLHNRTPDLDYEQYNKETK